MTLTEQPASAVKRRHDEIGPPKWLSVVLSGLIAFALGFLAFIPITHGGYFQIFQVEGQSMKPTYAPGDHALIMKTKDFEIGDIVVYQSPMTTVTCDKCFIVHRLVDRNDDGTWVTQGDNNAMIDPASWNITSSDLLGKVIADW